jgi:hypothetical protein
MKRRTLLKILPLSTAMAILPRAEAWPGTEHAGMENSNAAREPFIGIENNGIVEGAARFTVISAYCIRMEYAAKNGFVDAPTLFAYDRRRRLDGVEVSREKGALRIRTNMLSVVYRPDGKQFHPGNLSVTFDSGERKFTWEPGQKNSKNLGGPVPTLDGVGAPFALPDGLLSRDGWYLLDDSGQPVLIDGWIHQRAGGGPQGENEPPGKNPDLDWYLFAYGDDYKGALRSLAWISGPVPMPRREVHGSWYCRWFPYSTEQFREIVRGYHDHDFPIDILVMDMEWHTKDARYGFGHAGQLGWTGYTWNEKLIPQPQAFIEELRRDGIFLVLNDHPHDGVRDHERVYPQFMAMLGAGYPDNPPFDAGDPKYMQAFFQAAHTPIEKQGVDFWWVDWQQDHLIPWVHRVPGLRHLPWLNCLYYRQSEQMTDGKTKLRGQGFSRWGGWGSHRYPIQFSGDTIGSWEMLAFEIDFTLASGNAGCFFWAHDIGAFEGSFGTPRDSELFARWVQFGALSSSLRLHSDTDVDRRPWLWGKQFEDAMRGAYLLRSCLFPYIYSSIRQCNEETLPLLRPMYLEYPSRDEAYQYKTQYLFGDHLLAAPITTAGSGPKYEAERQVWFPEGTWFDFFSGEKFDGNQVRTVKAALDKIPLYVRAGAPIAMQPETLRIATQSLTTLVVRCYPGDAGNSVLYEDDGRSVEYRDGAYARSALHYERHAGQVKVRIDPAVGSYAGQPARRSYRIELPATADGATASVDGKKIPVEYRPEARMNVAEVRDADIRKPLEIVFHLRAGSD